MSFTYDIRNCYVPRPGYKLVTIDYANLELLSCATQLVNNLGYSNMADLINSGTKPVDLHSTFAYKLRNAELKLNDTYEYFMANKKKPEFSSYRDKSKPVTLGLPGGMGVDTIRGQFSDAGIMLPYRILQTNLSKSTAYRFYFQHRDEFPTLRVQQFGFKSYGLVKDDVVRLIKMAFELYPDLKVFLKEKHVNFQNGETYKEKNEFGEWETKEYYIYTVKGTDGSSFSRNYCTYTSLCNGYLMQSLGAMGAKYVGWLLFKEFHNDPNINVLAFIHDEYIFEIKVNSMLDQYVKRCSEIMIDGMKRYCDKVRVAVEWKVQNRWSKNTCESEGLYFKDVNCNILRTA